MGIAPCVVLSASSHIILSSRARHSTRVTRSSPVRFHLTRNTTDRRWIRRGYTVFRFRRNGFKDPSVYRREPLSLRSEPPPRRTRLTPSRSRRISPVRVHLHHRSLSASHLPLHLLLFVSFTYERPVLLRSRCERSRRRLLKEAGRSKTVLFPTAASSRRI